ncbi:MAG TPA: tripartite tricarboxylate transporter substrate binding protein [Burkholderiales bacterium]
MSSHIRSFFLAVIAFGAAAASDAAAQSFPSKPIQIIVPYQPGGPTDSVARVVGKQLSEALGTPVIVDNRPGAGSIIGMQACARAEADGHTLCLTVGDSLSYNPHLYKSLPYDPYHDFAPVIYIARGNSLIVASAKAPFSSYKEMVAYAKSNPGKLNWGTWGPFTTPDVYRLWLNHHAGISIQEIPYKGAVPTMTAILNGEIHITFMSIGFALPQIKAGKVRPIALVGDRRSPILPEVPTLSDFGADPGLGSYFGVFAPAKTPRRILEKLNAELDKTLKTEEVRSYLAKLTLDPVGGSVDQFADFVKKDQAVAGRMFKAIGVKPQ